MTRAAIGLARRLRRLKITLVAVLLTVSLVAGLLFAKARQIVLGAEAYIIGFPLVIMDVTRASQAANGGRENHLQRVRAFPDIGFRGVVRPNVDTLYTNAFIDNSVHRYALGSHDPLTLNPDGSLDLLIQADMPAPAQRANWLPVRAGAPFQLTTRLYWPKAAALSGQWSPPAVQRVD